MASTGQPVHPFAYVGEPSNLRLPAAAQGRVNVVKVDTKQADSWWLTAVSDLRCHYAIRSGKSEDGFKPFLKGFTAARLKVPIVIQRGDHDADYFLPSDYPYFVEPNASDDDIMEMLDYVDATYRTSVWTYALDIVVSLEPLARLETVAEQLLAALHEGGAPKWHDPDFSVQLI